jgi:homoserine kinase
VKSVTITIPASVANLGPGFDCLALALETRNELTLSIQASGVTVEIEGEGEAVLPRGEDNQIVRAAIRLFAAAGFEAPGLHLRSLNSIPLGSGLGSSAAAVVGGLTAANSLLDGRFSPEEILTFASELEGHADNAAAALHGGLMVAVPSAGGWIAHRLPIAEMQVGVVMPRLDLSTQEMRRILPHRVPLADASFNLAHLALALEAFRLGDYGLLALALHDRLHELRRIAHISGLAAARTAGLEAGASAVVLAGAGPGLLAFAAKDLDRVVKAMESGFASEGIASRAAIYSIAAEGVQITPG